VDRLSRALEAADRLVASLGEDQWGRATPCPDWTVRDLVNHLVLGMRLFANALGDPTGPTLEEARQGKIGDLLGDDPLGSYRDAARDMVAAFRQPGALDQVITIPFGSVPARLALNLRVVEALVHSWDLARATGRPALLEEDLAEEGLVTSRAMLAAVPPGRTPFGPPQPVADDAPASDRLAALLGRDVSAA
jgi:uncharacterized protein (TIGR03086 family)